MVGYIYIDVGYGTIEDQIALVLLQCVYVFSTGWLWKGS